MPAEAPASAIRNNVAEKLARDEVVASMTVRLVKNVAIATIAKACGFDTLYVDMEHNTFSVDETSQICMAALLCGVTPFVRVPALQADYIQRVLDGGALGIIASHIESAADARLAVQCAKYPPLGKRGAGGPFPHFGYRRLPQAEGNQALNSATMVVAMIETREGLDRVDEIAAVDGIDLLFIGASDMSNDFGIPGQVDHPRIEAAYRTTIAACRRHGKHVGIGGLSTKPELTARLVAAGARYVSTGAEQDALIRGLTERAQAVEGLRKLAAAQNPDRR